MKKMFFIAFICIAGTLDISAQQYKVITSVESIVPSGLDRSRILLPMMQ